MMATDAPTPLLDIRGLTVEFLVEGTAFRAVDGVSLRMDAGECLGVVGESGCGKSVTSLAILRLLPEPPARVVAGEILLGGRNLLALPPREIQAVRGKEAAMVFQEPMTSLNPVHTVGDQLLEAVAAHETLPRNEAVLRVTEALAAVGSPHPELFLRRYPHELSGGMKQRALIAMAIVCRPRLLICDEPTTALDVTIQAQVLDLLTRLRRERGMGMLFITHNLGVVAEVADRVAVMYAGRVVETASTVALFRKPRHPYTAGLFASLPRLDRPRGSALPTIPGSVPDPSDMIPGCRFAPRCPRAAEVCREAVPPLEAKEPGRASACHFPLL